MEVFSYDEFLGRIDESYFDWECDASMNVFMGAVVAFDAGPSPADIREIIARTTEQVPRFRELPVASALPLVPPRWIRDRDFDLDRHLRIIDLGPACPMRAAWQVLHESYSRRLDPVHPQWEWVYLHGLERGRALLLFRIHHMYSDGLGMLMLFSQALSPSPAQKSEDATPDGRRRLLRHVLRGARREWNDAWPRLGLVAKTLTTALLDAGARKELSIQTRRFVQFTREGATTRRRRLGSRNPKRWLVTRRLPREAFARYARERGAGINDAFVAFAARIVSRHYDTIGHEHEDVQVLIPVDRRRASEPPVVNNQILCAFARIARHDAPTSLPDVRKAVRSAIVPANNPVAPLFGAVLDLMPHRVRRWHARLAVRVADTVATNLMAPGEIVFAGAKVSELYAVAPSMASTATFALMTYGDHVHLTVVVNDGLVRDITTFVSVLDDELRAIAGPSLRPFAIAESREALCATP